MADIVSLLAFIASLGLLVFIHELGHFAAAKMFNVYVKEFSLGFGPVLWSFKKGETLYAVRAFPLGGYVAMVGEQSDANDVGIPPERSILGISKPKRALVMSAGILLNLLLAYLLFFISNIGFTQRTLTNQMVIAADSPASLAGISTNEVLVFAPIQQNELIATTDDGTTYTVTYTGFNSYSDELLDIIRFTRTSLGIEETYAPNSADDYIEFPLIIRTYTTASDFTERTATIRIDAIATGDGFALEASGIHFRVLETNYDALEALTEAGVDWWNGVTLIGRTILGLFVGENIDQVGGIVAIFSTTSSVLSNLGLGTYIFLWGLISVNLAIFNLLPFPGLDGWHLLVVLVESIIRREIPARIKNAISMVGFFILMALMILLLFKDLFSLR